MVTAEPEPERLLCWEIGVVALVLGAVDAVLILIFPSAGELSAVLLGCLTLCAVCVALAGVVSSLYSMVDVWSRRRAMRALLLNASAASLPFLAVYGYLLTVGRPV
jgi:uncharacterized membrane protein YozB (DUF420 family)